MKKITETFLFSSLLFTMLTLTGPVQAHGVGDNHAPQQAITSEQAVSLASKKVNELAKAGSIDISWVGVKSHKTEKKKFNQQLEWTIIFRNDKEGDKSKQVLYLFYSLSGQYIATNYTGD